MKTIPMLQRLIKTSLFFCLLPLTTGITHADDIIVSESLSRIELNNQLQYLFDEQRNLDLAHIITNKDTLNWQSGQQRQKELLMPAGVYWIKGQLTNPLTQPVTVTIEVKPASINLVDLHVIDEKGAVVTAYLNAGLNDSFENRPAINRYLVNTIVIPPLSSVTLLWRAEDAPLFKFSATAWEPKLFASQDQHMQLVHGMLYGTMLVMMLYNLFLYISIREKSYLFYVLYVASASYLLAADQGHLYHYLAAADVWPKFGFYTVIYAFNLVMFSQFCIYFLQLKKHSKRLRRTLRIVSAASAITVLLSATNNHQLLVLFSILAVTTLYITALFAGIYVRSKGAISAGHFVIAILILVFSMIATNMATLGLISTTNLTQSLAAIGNCIMLIFFSLALADRINQLQKENLEASNGIHKANNEKLKALSELKVSQVARIELEQSASRAKEESRAKNQFLATLSHEIRTPMSGIIGMAELIKTTTLDERQHHYLQTIEHSSQTLLSIIDDLLDYSKIQAGQISAERTSFNLEMLLDNCVANFALKSAEKNIHLLTDLDARIDPVLRGDATKLQQIIFNLLSNAFKFTETGSIVLSVIATDRNAINCVELKFSVMDSGIGLSEDEQQHLFTPFQHADKSTYGRYGGSGLGLAICKQLAELMDGHIGVNSASGKGSTFWFTARLMIDANPHPSLLKEKSAHLTGQKLLLVDSTPLSANIMQKLLLSWKIDVELADSISRAQELLQAAQDKQQAYSIILSAFELIDGNATAFAKSIKKHVKNQPTRFIVASTSQQLSPQADLAHTGIDLLLETPITFERLHCVLKHAITASSINTVSNMNTKTTNSQNQQNQRPLKVLLVEDNLVNQMVLTGLLSKLNIKPAIAADGLQAIEMIKAESFDLIFMDCEMPAMDGYEATRIIRANEQKFQTPAITIIALSAHATDERQRRAQQAGMNHYLSKPVSLNDLRKAIETTSSHQLS